mmetsp:Transcript_3200/g.7388  ORF Transcript_3200/g.7388 Transcript_3200/m.7388 type:complete len:150 (-) Transcript_3200:134-583(-)
MMPDLGLILRHLRVLRSPSRAAIDLCGWLVGGHWIGFGRQHVYEIYPFLFDLEIMRESGFLQLVRIIWQLFEAAVVMIVHMVISNCSMLVHCSCHDSSQWHLQLRTSCGHNGVRYGYASHIADLTPSTLVPECSFWPSSSVLLHPSGPP